jgi:hypothetical protein
VRSRAANSSPINYIVFELMGTLLGTEYIQSANNSRSTNDEEVLFTDVNLGRSCQFPNPF